MIKPQSPTYQIVTPVRIKRSSHLHLEHFDRQSVGRMAPQSSAEMSLNVEKYLRPTGSDSAIILYLDNLVPLVRV